MNKNKRFSLLIFLFAANAFLCSPNLLFAQIIRRSIDLNKAVPSWQTVLGGKIVSSVAKTSSGFAFLTDGRSLSIVSEEGNLIFQKQMSGKSSEFLSSEGDFICAITSENNLNFLNPSGFILWTKKIPDSALYPPFFGSDGRIFVVNKKGVNCFGIDGKQKWQISTNEPGKIPVCRLPDETFLLFLKDEQNGKTRGIRFSVFGEILEELTFSGKIIDAVSCLYGTLIVFNDGSYGLCAVQNEGAISLWIKNVEQNDAKAKIALSSISGEKSVLYKQTNEETVALVIDNKSGKTINEFPIGNLNLSDIRNKSATKQGFFISDSSRAIEFDENGMIFWEAKLPEKELLANITYTQNNLLIVFMNNWLINGYLMNQSVGTSKNSNTNSNEEKSKSQNLNPNEKENYSNLSELNLICKKYKSGNYGSDERHMSDVIKGEMQSYINSLSVLKPSYRENVSFYTQNPVYTQRVLEAAADSGTNVFAKDFAKLLSLETNPDLLKMLIINAGKSSFDSECEILSAFEDIVLNRMEKTDSALAKLICESTYQIVRFMGKESFYNKGKAVISHFLYPQYGKTSANIARETLKNIMKLQM